jgi:hypothetical protein
MRIMKQRLEEKFALTTSRGFTSRLGRGGVAFTTYQAGKVFFLGLSPDSKLLRMVAVDDA